jgi:2-amino-4-hydroxy-6-hydroxymethyldihydropteridine diphosphokinase
LLSLGSNLGDKTLRIQKAVNLISQILDVKLIISSSYYKTEPVGFTEQDWFVNSCILIETKLSASDLLSKLKYIEKKLGRKPRAKWHEREIDIDIILFGEEIIKSDTVQIPHPEMHKRSFVLVPACEIAPNMIHPIFKISIFEISKKLNDPKAIHII